MKKLLVALVALVIAGCAAGAHTHCRYDEKAQACTCQLVR